MTAPKKGDPVHVEYDGVVRGDPHPTTGRLPVAANGDGPCYVSPNYVSVIVPPIKVGDRATQEVLDALPLGSAIVTGSGLVASFYANLGGAWFFAGDPGSYTSKTVAEWNPTVIHIGGGS